MMPKIDSSDGTSAAFFGQVEAGGSRLNIDDSTNGGKFSVFAGRAEVDDCGGTIKEIKCDITDGVSATTSSGGGPVDRPGRGPAENTAQAVAFRRAA